MSPIGAPDIIFFKTILSGLLLDRERTLIGPCHFGVNLRLLFSNKALKMRTLLGCGLYLRADLTGDITVFLWDFPRKISAFRTEWEWWCDIIVVNSKRWMTARKEDRKIIHEMNAYCVSRVRHASKENPKKPKCKKDIVIVWI